jgi:ketol-acid reductoisomerase
MLRIAQASKRTLSTIARRAAAQTAIRSAASPLACQQRGIKTLKFADDTEVVYERADYPVSKLKQIFAKDTMAVIGYGTQGMAQSLNMKDNKLNVIVGVRKDGTSWKDAMKDGWVPGKTLFSIEEAIKKGTVIMNLLSDAGQKGIALI